MKKILSHILCFVALSCSAQDSTKTKPKEYLGVLTLVEKYRDDKNWTDKEMAIVSEHFKRLIRMKEDGIVLLAGRTKYETNNADMMGLVIFYAADDEAAKKIMMEDPAVKNNIMQAKVHPYAIAVSNCK